MHERKVKRYGAYFFGWCQAFGEHEITYEEHHDIYWLFAEFQIGITVAPRLRRKVLKEILKQSGTPTVTLADSYAQISGFKFIPTSDRDKKGLTKIVDFIRNNDEIHMFLTNHFCYPPGTKIVTLSTKNPLIILYKEIEPLMVKIA